MCICELSSSIKLFQAACLFVCIIIQWKLNSALMDPRLVEYTGTVGKLLQVAGVPFKILYLH